MTERDIPVSLNTPSIGTVRDPRFDSIAACYDVDADTANSFSPEDFTPDKRLAAEGKAKAVCNRCPVIGVCFEYAVSAREEFGILGGMTAEERKNKPIRDRALREKMRGTAVYTRRVGPYYARGPLPHLRLTIAEPLTDEQEALQLDHEVLVFERQKRAPQEAQQRFLQATETPFDDCDLLATEHVFRSLYG
ncbi:MAG: WhiB family transcriptional regulator, partial [Patescibacteria group bacterium]